jgi:hypothetical protein
VIVFLYFLQKKGWFGVGRDDNWGKGSKHFLRELFEKKHRLLIWFGLFCAEDLERVADNR